MERPLAPAAGDGKDDLPHVSVAVGIGDPLAAPHPGPPGPGIDGPADGLGLGELSVELGDVDCAKPGAADPHG